MEIEGKKKTVSPGELAHIPAGALHRAEVVGARGVTFITAKDTSWGIEGIPEPQQTEKTRPSRSPGTAARKKPKGGLSKARKKSAPAR